MGTIAKLYILSDNKTVGLWRRLDGYPEYIMPLLKKFIRYVARKYRNLRHWILYPEFIASELIYYDATINREKAKENVLIPSYPHWRPLFAVIDGSLEEVLDYTDYTYAMTITKSEGPWILVKILCFEGNVTLGDILSGKVKPIEVVRTKVKSAIRGVMIFP